MQRLRFEIKGMSCAACVSHVELAVKKVLSEEDEFTVSLLTNSVSILLKDDGRDVRELEEELSAAIKNAGYSLLTNKEKSGEKNRESTARPIVLLILSFVFTLGVMYLAMGHMIGLAAPAFLTGAEGALWMALAQLVLTLPVVVINFKFFKNGIRALIHRAPNMDSLIAVGSGASILYGLVSIVLIVVNRADHEALRRLVHDLYFESAAMILALVSFGKLLESRAKTRASDAVKSLSGLTPKTAAVLREGEERIIPSESVAVGDILLIRAGEYVPVDGEIVEGEGATDESALTGESMPVEKSVGDGVRAACILTSGFLKVRATRVGEDTSLSRIVRLLEDAASSKAPIARIADRVSRVFVPVVMTISLLTFLVWMLATGNVEQSLRSAIAVLVISCPCALGLATPTAITVGIGRGARRGILFCSAESLERLCSVRTVLFDKTGTVTEGQPAVTDVCAYGRDPRAVLSLAAAVERKSIHPLASAIVRCAEESGVRSLEAQRFTQRTGFGAEGEVAGKRIWVGKPTKEMKEAWKSIKEAQIWTSEALERDGVRMTSRAENASAGEDFGALEAAGRSTVVVTEDGEVIGIIGLFDRIRSDSEAVIGQLRRTGVRCVMLTGDNEKTAWAVADAVKMDQVYASLLPEDKERIVREESEFGTACAMVGDGINDAPALARADVGIAIGAGADVAIESADVVLSNSGLRGVAEAIALSRACMRIIKENLFWALFYNAVCIPVAAGVFYPILSWQLSPMLASAAMSCSSVFVVLNALRLRRIRLIDQAKEENKEDDKKEKGEESDMLFGEKVTYTVNVEGMMCPRCVAHVKDALTSLKGVLDAVVSLEEKTATVTVKKGKLDEASIKAAITAAGYKVV